MTGGSCLENDLAKQPRARNITFVTFGKPCYIFLNVILEKLRFSGSFLMVTLLAIDRVSRVTGFLAILNKAHYTGRHYP